jgi:proteasome assembly chaperone (PAC2) family protein
MEEQFNFASYTNPENPSLIIGWNGDTGKISSETVSFLNKKLNNQKVFSLEPKGYFPLGGVAVEDNCIQFPESIFFCGQRKDLVFFKSDQPEFNHYDFLNSVLDAQNRHGLIKELYTINGMATSVVHTAPRKIFAVFNHPELQHMLQTYSLEGLTWQGPPAVSSFLLWIAQRQGIPGLSLWLEVPFYLASVEDFQAIKLALSFFDRRFNLKLDLSELDAKIREQNEKIEQLRDENKEVNKYLGLIESGLGLKEEVQLKLAQEVYEYFKRNGG